MGGRAARLERAQHADSLVGLPAAFAPATHFCPSFQVLDCNSAMSRSRQSLAGSRIADFTLKLIWAPEQPTISPARKRRRYATFRQIKEPRRRLRQASSHTADFGYRP